MEKNIVATCKRNWHHIGNALATPLLGKPSDAPVWRVFFFLKKIPLFQRLKYQKKALSYDEQLSLLESRGLVVQDRDAAMQWLGGVSYYRFSAYLHTYRQPGSEQFRPGTNFAEIVDLYNFDRQLRLLMLDAIERIEVWARCALTYELAHRCGPFGYLRKTAFTKGFKHRRFRKTLRDENRRSKEAFVDHYRQKYIGENHLPIWMATEILTFGTISTLYSVLPLESKKTIANRVGLKDNVLSNWFQSVAYMRNLCAHHSRIWNRKFSTSPKLLRSPDFRLVEANKLYSCLLTRQYLLSKTAPNSMWTTKVAEFFKSNPQISARQMGFPPDWETRAPFGM